MTERALHVDIDVRLADGVSFPVDPSLVERVLSAAAFRVGQYGEVSVSFVTDEEIHELNRTYRGMDSPTDVLSFAFLEGEEEPVGSNEHDEGPILGDIIISVPTALRQAAEYGHSTEREIAFLLAHGYLHLVGYDHQTSEEEIQMFALQEEVLLGIGLSRENPKSDD